MEKIKEIIYLIGQISHDAEITYQWRQEVRKFFDPSLNINSNFEIIDPCDNEWSKGITDFSEDTGDPQRIALYKKVGSSLIVPKDCSYVMRSTGCIANMNLYDPLKPLVGTLFELAWYYQNPVKCVIGVFDGNPKEDKYCNHPFVRETVNVWCKNHMEAAQLLRNFYNRGVS